MIIQMQLLGFRIDEIPAVMHARSCGTSMHSGLKPVVYMFRMVFSIHPAWYFGSRCLELMRGQESGMFSWTKRGKRSFHAEI